MLTRIVSRRNVRDQINNSSNIERMRSKESYIGSFGMLTLDKLSFFVCLISIGGTKYFGLCDLWMNR